MMSTIHISKCIPNPNALNNDTIVSLYIMVRGFKDSTRPLLVRFEIHDLIPSRPIRGKRPFTKEKFVLEWVSAGPTSIT